MVHDFKNFDISKYNEEIIKPRNTMAHGVPRIEKEGARVFVHRGNEFKYDDQVAKKIREDLKKYKDIYESMLGKAKNS